MCLGNSNNAAKQAQANEDAKNAAIQQGVTQVNSIFDSPERTGQYDKLAADTTAYYTQQANQQQAINQRKLNFALARNGQVGGSVQTDQDTQAGKDYSNAILQATQRGQQAGANLRAADTTQRANLIAAVQGGLSATDAATQGQSAMQSTLQTAQSNATANQLGDAFGDFSSLYQQSQDAKALRQGMAAANQSLYTPGFGTATYAPSYGSRGY